MTGGKRGSKYTKKQTATKQSRRQPSRGRGTAKTGRGTVLPATPPPAPIQRGIPRQLQECFTKDPDEVQMLTPLTRSEEYGDICKAVALAHERAPDQFFKAGSPSTQGHFSGNFWDEGRRTRWLDQTVNATEKQAVYTAGQWNHYRVIAQGDRIRSFVNNVPVADFRDNRDASGFIGLQVHSIKKAAGPYSVSWKNVRIRELAAGDQVD